ncbi:hypothetical protein EYF80_035870 [Liparis tanakae]|uniref:Uncharacterized protein n=1 Tax=Liparis tanakae TaxID=230148 RepID=A0A4Z2GM63_9TELE|nr:hypothetical protein EYF80_035870 [Liparis tanakae]
MGPVGGGVLGACEGESEGSVPGEEPAQTRRSPQLPPDRRCALQPVHAVRTRTRRVLYTRVSDERDESADGIGDNKGRVRARRALCSLRLLCGSARLLFPGTMGKDESWLSRLLTEEINHSAHRRIAFQSASWELASLLLNHDSEDLKLPPPADWSQLTSPQFLHWGSELMSQRFRCREASFPVGDPANISSWFPVGGPTDTSSRFPIDAHLKENAECDSDAKGTVRGIRGREILSNAPTENQETPTPCTCQPPHGGGLTVSHSSREGNAPLLRRTCTRDLKNTNDDVS